MKNRVDPDQLVSSEASNMELVKGVLIRLNTIPKVKYILSIIKIRYRSIILII